MEPTDIDRIKLKWYKVKKEDAMEDLREGPDYQTIAEKAGYRVSDYEDNPELWYYYKIDDTGATVICGEDYRCPLDAWEAACEDNGLA